MFRVLNLSHENKFFNITINISILGIKWAKDTHKQRAKTEPEYSIGKTGRNPNKHTKAPPACVCWQNIMTRTIV